MIVTAVNLEKTNFTGISTLLLPYNISHTALSCCHPALASDVASLLNGKVGVALHLHRCLELQTQQVDKAK